jgi:hypothetical protein
MRREILNNGRIGPDRELFMRDIGAGGIAREPFFVGEQPDIDAELVQDGNTAFRRGCRDQMLLDRIQLGIDDRTAVEGADRQGDLKRLDQKPHADGRAARGDGEADAALVQFANRGLRGFGQGLVLGQQRAIHIRYDEGDAGHARFPKATVLAAGSSPS